MPSWGEILVEIQNLAPNASDVSPLDRVRRKYLAQLAVLTGRTTIVYSTRWTLPAIGAPIPPQMLAIGPGDIQGFMEAVFQVGG